MNPKAEVFQNMTGSLPRRHLLIRRKGPSWQKPSSLKGADVVYAAAGGTGLGVYQAAKDAGKLAIGVDANQNHLHPGTMLTSMVKSVGLASFQSWDEAAQGKWKGGKSVRTGRRWWDWAQDENNAKPITPEMKTKMDSIKQDIIAGKIKIHDYMADNTCKY